MYFVEIIYFNKIIMLSEQLRKIKNKLDIIEKNDEF